MRRSIIAVVLALGLVAAVFALPSYANHRRHTADWEATAGHFKTQAEADARIAALDAKGFHGYTTEKERDKEDSGRRFEVEKPFPTKQDAKAEAKKLRDAGFKNASVERS